MYRKVNIEIVGEQSTECISPPELAIHKGASAILNDHGVHEFVRVIDWVEVQEQMPTGSGVPVLLRQSTLQDQAKADENTLRSKMARKTCEKAAEELKLALHMVRIRYNFDRTVLHIVFTAEENLDTTDLIKKLSQELSTKIDIGQIGVRDEAKIIGGIGPCGRTLCCCSFLDKFESINVKMAKAQKVSLNPASMSGMCDRLKCCLGYEYDQYREMSKTLPNYGKKVETPDGSGTVVNTNTMAQEVNVQLEDKRIITYNIDDIRVGCGGKCNSRKHN
ncbi:MAG: stage 0 sporulation protein [Kiritimatiellae bacterium]|nr:stage 0 sporulation protein [Kiritimatiellia bacterium]